MLCGVKRTGERRGKHKKSNAKRNGNRAPVARQPGIGRVDQLPSQLGHHFQDDSEF